MEFQLNIDEMCRLCLRAKTPGMILLEISDEQQNKFEEITNKKLNLDIGLPKSTCSDCSDHLENFYFYKNQLLRKQNELFQVLKASQEQNKIEENQLEYIENEEHIKGEDVEMLELPENYEEEVVESGEEFLNFEELEELDNDLPVPRLEEIKYEKVKPVLVLTSNFLKARETLRLQPSVEGEDNVDYSTCVIIGEEVEKNIFICNNSKCENVELTSQEEMKLHLLDHKFDSGPQKCNQCPLIFKTRHFYEKHVESCHSEPLNQICQICGKICQSRIQLRSHLRNHDQTLKYKCNFDGCSKAFRVKHHLDNHMRAHTKESPFVCDFSGCPARFRQKHALTIHMRKHNNEFITCEQCKSPFVTQFQLNKHLEKCNGTFKPLKTRVTSNIKREIDPSDAVFKCSVVDCTEKFKAKVTLEKHLTKFHQVQLTPSTCILCCEELESSQALKSHLRNHLPFTCTLCSASFKNKANYTNHVAKSHAKDEIRLHKCRECQASFKRAEHLRTHIVYKHNTLRPFSCDLCTKQSMTKNDLNSHMKTHKIV